VTPRDIFRLALQVERSEAGCWEWRGARTAGGYGAIWLEGKIRYAHRVVYELANGAIPDGFQIDHLCKNRGCVNPAHIEAVTQLVNNMRSDSICAKNARKEFCVHGHSLADASVNVLGHRKCRTCERRYKFNRRERRRLLKGREPESESQEVRPGV
jgi:hypothetical protein